MIELLVVIVIISLLSSLELLGTALDSFRLDTGRYPITEEGLKILWVKQSDIKGWNGPYLPKPVEMDAWQNPYEYTSPGEDGEPYNLLSLGADGRKGGENDNADISIWTQ